MGKKSVYFGVFTALALIVSYVEALIPFSFGVPGIKLGLANIVVVAALYMWGGTTALLLSVVRILLSGFLFGNMFAILYSLAGALMSLSVMALLKKSGRFSVTGVSIAGGVFHNIGQMMAAGLLLPKAGLLYYFPFLLIAGVITGFLIGILSMEIIKRLPKGSKK